MSADETRGNKPEAAQENEHCWAMLAANNQEIVDETLGCFEEEDEYHRLDGVNTGADLIGMLVTALDADTTPNILVIDSGLSDFPSLELGFSIRAIETAFGDSRIPIIIVGEGDDQLKASCRQLGNARFVSTVDLTPKEFGKRVTVLVQKVVRGAR